MVAEALAAVSAAMQAIDFFEKHGGTRASVVQTLNLRYEPQKFRAAEQELRTTEPQLFESYEKMFAAILKQTKRCTDNFVESIGDETLLPQQREHLGEAGRKCVCGNIRQLKNMMPGRPLPPVLQTLWKDFECSKFFDPGDDEDSPDSLIRSGSARRLEPA